MHLIADENVELAIIRRLRADGLDVYSVAESAPDRKDPQILQLANDTRSILITGDKDFGELVFRLKGAHFGIVLIRLDGLLPVEKAAIASSVFKDHGNELEFAFTVISKTSVRIRKT